MTRMLDIVQDFLTMQKYSFERLDGSIRGSDRFEALQRFSTPHAPNCDNASAFVFLLSVRAGGQGLNLTHADTCIFLDSDFNPQVDLQAEDRAHRIGQQKAVLVLRFLSQKTVEEGILLSARKKAAIAEQVLGPNSSSSFDSPGSEELAPRALLDAILVGAQAAIDAQSHAGISGESGSVSSLWQGAAASISDAAAQCKGSFDQHFASCDWSRVLARHDCSQRDEEFVSGGSGACYELEYQPLELGSTSLDTSRLQGGVAISDAGHARRPVADASSRRSRDVPSAEAASEAAAAKAAAAKTRRAAKWEAAGYTSQRLPLPADDDVSLEDVSIAAESDDGSRPGCLSFVVGDAARPSCTAGGRHFIMHCVDDGGSWPDRGVFKALSDAHGTQIAEAYELAHKMKDLHLGDAHCVPLSSSSSRRASGVHSVVLLVCLERLSDGSRRIEMSSFRLGVMALRHRCMSLAPGITSHFHTPMPPPPCPWYAAERVLMFQLLRPFPLSTITVYYFRRAAAAPSSAPVSSRESQTSRLARAFFAEPADESAAAKQSAASSDAGRPRRPAQQAPPQRAAPAVAASGSAPVAASGPVASKTANVPSSPPAAFLSSPPVAPLFHGLKFALHQLAWGTASLQVGSNIMVLVRVLLTIMITLLFLLLSGRCHIGHLATRRLGCSQLEPAWCVPLHFASRHHIFPCQLLAGVTHIICRTATYKCSCAPCLNQLLSCDT